MRSRRVTAGAFHRDCHAIGRRHERTLVITKCPRRNAGLIVEREHGIARKALEQSVGEHALGAAVEAGFLGRLKDEVDRAREAARRSQMFCTAEQHCRVAVVAARVHGAAPAVTARSACGRISEPYGSIRFA